MDADPASDDNLTAGGTTDESFFKREVGPFAAVMRPRVHQFHNWAASGDAITNQMLFIRSVLREAGFDSEIFARHIKGRAADPIHSEVARYDASMIASGDWLLLHHSQGDPDLSDLLKLPIKKAAIYHNITPPAFFSHDPKVAALCRLGREQLRLITGHCEHWFADSQFNAGELTQIGARNVVILPLIDLSLEVSRPASPVAKEGRESRQILFVGRWCPHKDQAALISVVAHLTHEWQLPVQLKLVGRGDPIYSLYLKTLAQHHHLETQVQFLSGVSNDQLVALYQEADVFLCLSHHEGFCVPIVEAMRSNLPLISTLDGALGETLGQAGVQLMTRDTRKIAAIVGAILSDARLLTSIAQSAKSRLNELRALQNRGEALRVLKSKLGLMV